MPKACFADSQPVTPISSYHFFATVILNLLPCSLHGFLFGRSAGSPPLICVSEGAPLFLCDLFDWKPCTSATEANMQHKEAGDFLPFSRKKEDGCRLPLQQATADWGGNGSPEFTALLPLLSATDPAYITLLKKGPPQ